MFLPSHYMIRHETVTCLNCTSVHGNVTTHLVQTHVAEPNTKKAQPAPSIAYNLPIHLDQRPPVFIPVCPDCAADFDTSSLPVPASVEAWNKAVALKEQEALERQAARRARDKARAAARDKKPTTVDDFADFNI